MAAAWSEAWVEAVVCSSIGDEAVTCSGARIEEGRQRRRMTLSRATEERGRESVG
jgi:hypothetical protein